MSISFVIPTKDRPEKLNYCLLSLSNQQGHESIDQVVIVGCGKNVGNIVHKYSNQLKVRYIHTERCGQLYQRNIGIDSCILGSDYICFLDDDVILLENAYLEMVNFIAAKRKQGSRLFGVGFNVVNLPYFDTQKHKRIKKMLFQIGNKPGDVTITGMNTSFCSVPGDQTSKWLNGGTTVWSKSILDKYRHREINTRYAAAEDLLYSYPIGKTHDLFVCASAKVTVTVDTEVRSDCEYLSKRETIAHLFFCGQHKELSGVLYSVTRLVFLLGNLKSDDRNTIRRLIGFIQGTVHYVKYSKLGWNVLDE